jgi:hypothetical protein
VVKVDAANDLALLKAEGRFAALPVVASRAMRLGSTVATVGFPNPAGAHMRQDNFLRWRAINLVLCTILCSLSSE